MTPGNSLSRYIGTTDEKLSEEGKEELLKKREQYAFVPDLLITSPMIRCQETAAILFPEQNCHIIENLKEFDFGIFENQNYQELNGNVEYQKWLDSFCEAPVPNGESMKSFKERTRKGFEEALQLCTEEQLAAMVVHGGTIMALMEAYADEKKGYYDWHVKNGEGFFVQLDLDMWKNGKKEFFIIHE